MAKPTYHKRQLAAEAAADEAEQPIPDEALPGETLAQYDRRMKRVEHEEREAHEKKHPRAVTLPKFQFGQDDWDANLGSL